MVEKKDFNMSLYYADGIEIEETGAGIEITAGSIKKGDETYPMEAVSFDLQPDDTTKVAYQLYVLHDIKSDEISYLLTKTYVEPDGYYQGYSGSKKLIMIPVQIVVDPQGNREGLITIYVQNKEDGKDEA
ncbi:Uncharacterised protein [Streptococcus pneumoniae]|nr:Uncharacterised protein [Streptococcus pneumoniae]